MMSRQSVSRVPFKLLWMVIWALLVAGVVYAVSGLDWSRVDAAASHAEPAWLVLALLINLSSIPLWGACWRCLVPEGGTVTWARLTQVLAMVLSAVQALSLFGGGATAYVLTVERLRLSRSVALSLLLLDQFVTGIVKVLLIGAALALAPTTDLLRSAGGVLLVGMTAGAVLLVYGSRSRERLHRLAARTGGRSGALIEAFGNWTVHLSAVRRLPAMFGAVTFMLVRRLTEGMAALCIARALGIPVGPEVGLLITAFLAVVTLVPSPPGNLALYEVAVVAAYQSAGVATETAVAAALVQHAVFLIAALAPGALVLAFTGLPTAQGSRGT